MSEFTTIQVTKDVRNKLDVKKSATGKKYNDVIEDLLENAGGSVVNDVITINRDTTALSLKFWEVDNPASSKFYDITFQELKVEPVGTKFTANDTLAKDTDYVNSNAEIVYRKGDDVILLVEEVSFLDGVFNKINSVVHVNLF